MHASESHPPAEYFVANHDRFIGLLDLASELVLRYDPVVTVLAEAAAQPSISIWGQDLQEYDPQTPDGAEAAVRAHEARHRLAGFISQVGLRLLHGESANDETAVSSDQARSIVAVMNASGRTYASLAFEYRETGQQLTVETMTMHGETAPLARGLAFQIDDDVLSRSVSVGYLEQPPLTVVSPLWVEQAVEPARDNETQRMAEFFLEEHGDLAGFAAMLEVFRRELQGRSSNELLASLYEQYQDEAARAELAVFVTVLQRRALEARQQRSLVADNPELTRPSSAELDEYAQLFRSLLGT